MDNYSWENEIEKWVQNKKSVRDHKKELTKFFFNAFSYNRIPDKSYFGATSSSISLLIGGIYLAANIYTGNEKGIWLLLDKDLSEFNEKGVEVKSVLSTKNSSNKLFWFHSNDVNSLSIINQTKHFWESYSLASVKVVETPKGYSTRPNYVKNKIRLSSFWHQEIELIESEYLNLDLENAVANSMSLTKSERLERLKMANKQPIKIVTKTTSFIRNPDVIAEVLHRSKGICESCKIKAPFNRDRNNTPYLETHHIIPLSKGGEDIVENAIALCPNCHRHAHFGKKTFKLNTC